MVDHFSHHYSRHWFITHRRRNIECIQELRGGTKRDVIDIFHTRNVPDYWYVEKRIVPVIVNLYH